MEKTASKQEKPAATVHIHDCSVINHCNANEHTRASIVALAEAVTMNAKAVIAAAEALKGGSIHTGHGFMFSDINN